jgi:hypothetical protein
MVAVKFSRRQRRQFLNRLSGISGSSEKTFGTVSAVPDSRQPYLS